MKVLVTGGAGFLGNQLLDDLISAGHEARSLDVKMPFEPLDAVDYRTGSILEGSDLTAAMAGCDAVIHAAAISDFWSADRSAFDRVNTLGTQEVLNAARSEGIRVVHVSSYTTLIGRESRPDQVLTETDAQHPSQLLGPYPKSKRQAEMAVMSAASDGGDALSMLPAALIGPCDHRPTQPGGLLSDLYFGRLPALMPSRLSLVDVRDVSEAIVAALEKGAPGGRYLLAGHDIELQCLAQKIHAMGGSPPPRRLVPKGVALAVARGEAMIAHLTGRAPLAPLTGVRLACRPVRFDTSLSESALGFRRRSLEATLQDTVDWRKFSDGKTKS
ncbi:MAG: NAD-dependent epimerase/dehydratase family protein [Pseudomonadota bacterium]